MKREMFISLFLGMYMLSCGLIASELSTKDKLDWSLNDAYKVKTLTREKISLNGVWKISLQSGKGLFKQEKLTKREEIIRSLSGNRKQSIPLKTFEKVKKWKQIRVPGLWFDTAWYSSSQYESMLGRDKYKKPQIRVCNKVNWFGKPLKDFYYAWYEREFSLPKGWKAEETFLKFNKFNRKGWVFVNNKFVGYQEINKSIEMPIPADIKPDQKIKLDILVSAFVSGNDTLFMGGKQIHRIKKKALLRGISGDGWLIRRSSHQYIKDTFITSSVRQKKLSLKVKFSGKAEDGVLIAEIANWKDGKRVKTYPVSLRNCIKIEENYYKIDIPWKNPVLWTPDTPHLYTLKLAWKGKDGKIIDEDFPRRFGFREIWIKGRNYYLNGFPVHFCIAPAGKAMPKSKAMTYFKDIKKMGKNSLEILAGKVADNCDISEIIEAADECGVMILFMLPDVNKIVYTWQDETERKNWIKKLKASLNHVKNHPSIVQWGMNFNLLGYPFDLEPSRLGMDYYPSKTSSSGSKWKVAKQSQEILKELDSSRPTYHHAGGNFGEAHTSNMYLCFSPVQEKSEWPRIWAKKGTKPFIPIELGMPCELSYYHCRQGVGSGNNFKSEPLYAEYGARILGPKVYSMADSKRMKKILSFSVDKLALGKKSDRYRRMKGYYYTALRAKSLDDFINIQCVLGEFIRDWRTYGISGYNPWFNKYALWNNLKPYNGRVAEYTSLKTPGYKTLFEYKTTFSSKTLLHEKYLQWLKPELLYLCGPSNEFTDKGGVFYTGTDIKKGFAWVNDTFRKIKARIKVELVNKENGKIIFDKTYELEADPGQIQLHDFSFQGPNVKRKTDLLIKLYKNSVLVDENMLRIFPKLQTASNIKLKKKIYLLDSKGYTLSLFKRLGIPCASYSGESLGENDLMIIGRESLDTLSPYALKISRAVKNGMNLIIFEQKAAELEESFGLRCVAASARKVFLEKNSSELMKNIDEDDLANWPGKASLLEEYPKPQKDKYPRHIWKFGNRQVISSVTIEKPHKGPYRSWLHEGFDLAYTPLLEENCGKGKVIFCQLDVSGRSKISPVADIISRNLIKYMDKVAEIPRKMFYIGGEEGKRILKSTGVSFSEIDKLKELPKESVLVIGDSKNYSHKKLTILKNLGKVPEGIVLDKHKKELNRFLFGGGKILVLASNSIEKIIKTFGLNIKANRMNDYKFKHKNIVNITDGLGGGDWYWKDIVGLALPEKDFPLKKIKIGKGILLICQINPFYYTKAQMHQRRERSRAKMTRILSTVFCNLGASFERTTMEKLNEGKKLKDINLEGKWNFNIDPYNNGLKLGWHLKPWIKCKNQLDVPGTWESQGIKTRNPRMNGKLPYDGYAWYQKQVLIPASLKGKQLYLEMGTADDYDWSYFNGKEIGKTGKEHPKYYDTRRYYPIPSEIIKYDKKNLIAIRIFDNYLAGGIPKGPVQITFKKVRKIPYLDANVNEHLRFDPYYFHRW